MRSRVPLITCQALLGATMTAVGVLKFVVPHFKVADDVVLQSFIDTGWLWQLIGAAEMIGGLAVASNRLVPLGLAILAPVVSGIAAFAFTTGGEEASIGIVVLALHLVIAWNWRAAFAPLVRIARHP